MLEGGTPSHFVIIDDGWKSVGIDQRQEDAAEKEWDSLFINILLVFVNIFNILKRQEDALEKERYFFTIFL